MPCIAGTVRNVPKLSILGLHTAQGVGELHAFHTTPHFWPAASSPRMNISAKDLRFAEDANDKDGDVTRSK